VKVATFKINNINKQLDNLLAWLAKAEPDVVSFQELKAEQGAFPVNALRTAGYEAVWQGERSWNGVAILARNHAPVLTCASLPGDQLEQGFPAPCSHGKWYAFRCVRCLNNRARR
jgi:exodeoxyribonuclease-3